MNIKLATGCFVVAASLVSISAYSADSDMDRSHPTNFVKDSVITTKVKTKLAGEKLSSLAKVKVDTDDKGVVYLSGHVESQKQADQAVAIAKATEGVRSVKSDLVIKKDD